MDRQARYYGSDFTGVDKTAISIAINNTEYLEFPDIDETRKVFEMMSRTGVLKKTGIYRV